MHTLALFKESINFFNKYMTYVDCLVCVSSKIVMGVGVAVGIAVVVTVAEAVKHKYKLTLLLRKNYSEEN